MWLDVASKALTFSDEFVEHLCHQGRVPAHDGGGCCDVADSIKVLPVEDKAGITGKLLEERALGPAVALTERVDRVDLTEVVRQPFREHVPGKAAQQALAMQRMEELRRRGLDVLRQAEPGSFRDGDGPELSGPTVDVTENPVMDRAQVPEVVAWLER
jgi:hypothetical protein